MARARPAKAKEWASRAVRNIAWCEEHLHFPKGRLSVAAQDGRIHEGGFQGDLRQREHHQTSDHLASEEERQNLRMRLHLAPASRRSRAPPQRPTVLLRAKPRSGGGAVSPGGKIIRLSPKLRDFITIRDAAKELRCLELGTSYKSLSSEVSTAYGLSPALTIFDELGQVRGPRDALFEAMETSTAGQADPLTIIISTQAPSDQDLLSVLVDDAGGGHDPSTVLRLDAAPEDADPFAEETIRRCNPAYDLFMNQKEVKAMAAAARRLPTREAPFKNLVLNMRIEAERAFLTATQWKACGGPPKNLEGREVYGGLDLSETRDLTALVLIGRDPLDGTWSVKPIFWLPSENLAEKARADRVPFDLWAKQGHLLTAPGASISYEYVARYLWTEVFARHRVIKIGFDRWGFRHLRPWLLAAGFPESVIKETFVEFGQGTQSMSPALRELESMVLDRKLRHGGHPVLNWNASNTVTEGADASNRKLSKRRSSGRIDGMVALAMAIGVAPLTPTKIDISTLIV